MSRQRLTAMRCLDQRSHPCRKWATLAVWQGLHAGTGKEQLKTCSLRYRQPCGIALRACAIVCGRRGGRRARDHVAGAGFRGLREHGHPLDLAPGFAEVSSSAGACPIRQVKRECERVIDPSAAAPATVTGEGIRRATGQRGWEGRITAIIRKPGDLPADWT